MMKQLHALFESKVEVPRIKVGRRQTIETLINEEALLLAKFLREERKTWTPRIAAGPPPIGAGQPKSKSLP